MSQPLVPSPVVLNSRSRYPPPLQNGKLPSHQRAFDCSSGGRRWLPAPSRPAASIRAVSATPLSWGSRLQPTPAVRAHSTADILPRILTASEEVDGLCRLPAEL